MTLRMRINELERNVVSTFIICHYYADSYADLNTLAFRAKLYLARTRKTDVRMYIHTVKGTIIVFLYVIDIF